MVHFIPAMYWHSKGSDKSYSKETCLILLNIVSPKLSIAVNADDLLCDWCPSQIILYPIQGVLRLNLS